MQLPSFRRKQKLKAADLQTLADAIRANRILPGVGIRITGSPNGTTVAVKRTADSPPASLIHPFQFVSAPWTGTGTPPSDQKRKFRIRPGAVMSASGPRFSENLHDVFTAPDNAAIFYCWLEANFDMGADGYVSVLSISYDVGATLPEQQTASDPDYGSYPTKSFIPLFAIKTQDGAIKEVQQYVKSSLSLTMVLEYISCGTAWRRLFWSAL